MDNRMLSIILLSYYSETRLEKSTQRIIRQMEKEQIPFEIIIIDDGSSDLSYPIALRLEKDYPNVRAYQMSKNYTSPYVHFAGFKLAKGACAVPVPDDLQRPLDVVVEMYRKWENGAKIVVAYHDKRSDGFWSDLLSNLYYKFMNRFSEIQFPPGGADGFLADREIIDIINKNISPRNTSSIVEVLRLGFDPVFFPYTRPKSKGKSRWTLRKKLKLAQDTFLSSSNFPIRLITIIGFLTFIFSILIILLIFIGKLFSDNTLFGLPIPGWATIMVTVSFFNGLVLFSLGVVASYIWRIHEEVKGRPGYIIKQKEDFEK